MKYRDYDPNQSCLPAEAYLRLTGAVRPVKSPITTIISAIRHLWKVLFVLLLFAGCKEKPPKPKINDSLIYYVPKKEQAKPLAISI
jgi:hypothetical protein